MKIKRMLAAVLSIALVTGYMPVMEARAAEQPLADGYYTIMTAMDTGYGLDLSGNSTSSGTNVQLYNASDSDVRVFGIKLQSDGYYRIWPKEADTSLDLADNKTNNGTNIRLFSDNGTNAQRWKIEDAGDGYYYIKSKSSLNYCLDLNGGAVNNANISLWTFHGGDNQKWKFESRNSITGEQTVPDGDYMVMSSLDSAYGLQQFVNNDVRLSYLNSDTLNNFSRFSVKYMNDGTYKISLKQTPSLCLDLYGGNKAVYYSQNVQLYSDNSSDYQRWIIEDTGGGSYYIRSKVNGSYLDISGGAAVYNANICSWSLSEGDSMKWVFSPEVEDTGISDICAFSMVNGIRIRWTAEDDPNGRLYRIDKDKPTGSAKSSSGGDGGLPAGIDIKYRSKEEKNAKWTTLDIPLETGKDYVDITNLEGGVEYEYTVRPYYMTTLLGITVGGKRYKQDESEVMTRTTMEANQDDIVLGDSTHELLAKAARDKGWFTGVHMQYYIGTENCIYDMVNKNKDYQMRIAYRLINSKIRYCWEIYDYKMKLHKSVYMGTLSALKEDMETYAENSKAPMLSTEYVEYVKGEKATIKLKNASQATWSLAKSANDRVVYGGVEIVKKTADSVTIEFTEPKGLWGIYPYVQAKVGNNIYRCYIMRGERPKW